ncbi:MAG: copper resistance protein NlpE N-terminal domain-containing protein [Methylococcales bacterium]|nr:copper resistance protein NlpE N-terminal domain-containing protein [Methylococcales bacterium]
MSTMTFPVINNVLYLTLLLSLAACTGESMQSTGSPVYTPTDSQAWQAAQEPAPDGHTSRIALDWAGTYSGVLPCASCPGIETRVTLNQNGSFERRRVYIDDSPLPQIDTGTFSWDQAGRKVTLTTEDMEPEHYQIGEHRLLLLDIDRKRIEGALAGRYILEQHIHDPRIENRRWILVELYGQPVKPLENQREAFLLLGAEDGRYHGNASCNMYNGAFAIKTGQRIDFGRNIAMTMMACPDMQLEQQFIEVLQTVDNYSLGDDGSMTLNRARIAPLARFVEAPSDTD